MKLLYILHGYIQPFVILAFARVINQFFNLKTLKFVWQN